MRSRIVTTYRKRTRKNSQKDHPTTTKSNNSEKLSEYYPPTLKTTTARHNNTCNIGNEKHAHNEALGTVALHKKSPKTSTDRDTKKKDSRVPMGTSSNIAIKPVNNENAITEATEKTRSGTGRITDETVDPTFDD